MKGILIHRIKHERLERASRKQMGAELDAAEPLLNDAQPTCAPLIQIHEPPFRFRPPWSLRCSEKSRYMKRTMTRCTLFWEYFTQKLHVPRCLRATGRTWARRDGGRRVLTRRCLGRRFAARAFMIMVSRAVLFSHSTTTPPHLKPFPLFEAHTRVFPAASRLSQMFVNKIIHDLTLPLSSLVLTPLTTAYTTHL